MNRYRIIKKEKKGYYCIYMVEERFAFFLWTEHCRAFDDVDKALQWINDREAKEVSTIVALK